MLKPSSLWSRPWILISVVLFVALTARVIYVRQQQHSMEAAMEESGQVQDGDTGEAMLQVPFASTVEKRKEFADALVAWKDQRHLQPLYDKWMDVIGANGIIEVLQKMNPECHDIAHDLGRIVYRRVGSVGDALRTCESACNSACMHGVLMESFVKDIKIQEATSTVKEEPEGEDDDGDHLKLTDLKEKMTSLCGSSKEAGNAVMAAQYKQGDCVHGVGHAVMFLSKYNIAKAMEYCQLLDTPVLKYYCATGAYMEYTTTHDAADTHAHVDNPFYPCDQATYPAACFRYKMAHVVSRWYQAGKTLGQLQDACLALEGKYQTGCFHGLGNGHFVPVALKKTTLAQICSAGSHDDQYACTEGLIERLGRYEPDNARTQCQTVSGWQKELCLDDVKHELYDLTKPFELYVP